MNVIIIYGVIWPYDLMVMIIFFHNIYIGSIPIMVKW